MWLGLHLIFSSAVSANNVNDVTNISDTITINMCYEEQQLEPYFMGSGPVPPEEHPGIFIEMMYLLDENIPDIKIRLHRAPWKRCLNELKQSSTDVVIASYKPERELLGIYPKSEGTIDQTMSISTSEYCLFTKRNSELIWDGSMFTQIPQKPVAVPQGYSIISLLKQHNIPLVFTNSSLAAMDLLNKSVATGAVTYCESGGNYLWENAAYNPGIIAQSPTLTNSNAFLLFSRIFYQQYPAKAQLLWREAVAIRDTQFRQLLDKYETLRFAD